jgi:hypothetical protein
MLDCIRNFFHVISNVLFASALMEAAWEKKPTQVNSSKAIQYQMHTGTLKGIFVLTMLTNTPILSRL